MTEQKQPETLQQAIAYYSNIDHCMAHLVAQRWPDGVECPTCGSKDVRYISTRRIWECKHRHEKKQFSIKTGTFMEDSPIGLDKWLTAIWLIAACKNGVSSYEIHRAIGVTQKTAWFMLHRIRLGMQTSGGKFRGNVEVDETFIGGKARNMHKSKREQKIRGRGASGKVVVIGTLQRSQDGKPSQVRAEVAENRNADTLHGFVKGNVSTGANLYSDEFSGYAGLENEYDHRVINHAEEYVRGLVHTQGMDNFWSLLKRCLHGTYVSVEPFHLFRYIDEESFRFNNRATKKHPMNDVDRFKLVTSNMTDKRLTYKQLTGQARQA